MPPAKSVLFTHFTTTSCLGCDLDATLDVLYGQRGGLALCTFPRVDLDTWIGEVPDTDTTSVRADLADFDRRNNRFAQIGFTQDGFAESVEAAKARRGAGRVGVFIGTNTSGILETERAYQQCDPQTGALPTSFHYAQTHNVYSPAAFVRAYFGLSGPATAISSARSSGVEVFASARRMSAAGLINAVVVSGADSLCLVALHGFNSLELLSRRPCRPYDMVCDGISIGETAAFALLECASEASDMLDDDAILLLGTDESSDAHHMSSPYPEGLGACAAMAQALVTSDLSTVDIDHISLHGTGTPSNGAAEFHAIQVLLHGTVCSSTKGAIGYVLGAAGALEAVITALALRHRFLPAGINITQPDSVLIANCLTESGYARVRMVPSNAFGFGGANRNLVFGRVDHLGLSS